MIILVGSEGGSTWGFAKTLHKELADAGHRVHVAAMNDIASTYPQAEQLIIFAATYGEGGAPASANRFLKRLSRSQLTIPVAIVGFGDRSFPQYCRFAEDVAAALSAQGGLALFPVVRINRQSPQEFHQWGKDFGAAIGTPLMLHHEVVPEKTTSLELFERVDYGIEVQAPTSIFRFVAIPSQLPKFQAGDLVGILPPGNNAPRFYSLASSSREGVLDICVRKQPGGLCSSFLHDMKIGDRIDCFIRENPAFRPTRGKTPLVLIGAGAGIGPLIGIIRANTARRPVHLYWGGRHPSSDFLFEEDLAFYIAEQRLRRCGTAFSRVTNGCYVQDRIARESSILRDLLQHGAQVMVCGGRDMADNVASVIDHIVRPIGLDLAKLKSEGRYLEDVY